MPAAEKHDAHGRENFKLPSGVEDEFGKRSTGQAQSSVGRDNGGFKLPGDLEANPIDMNKNEQKGARPQDEKGKAGKDE